MRRGELGGRLVNLLPGRRGRFRQIDYLHGRVSIVMRGVVHQRRLRLDDAGSEVVSHPVQRHLAPQAGLGHDLIELLELAEAGDVLAVGLVAG